MYVIIQIQLREIQNLDNKKKIKKGIDKLKKICYNTITENKKIIFKKEVFTMTKKMTKREMYEQIKANYALTEEEVAFIDHELELLAKKNASTGERKPTATQKANEGVKDAIVDVLVANGEQMTVSEIVKVIDGDYTNQKISALLRQLIADGKVEKVVDKRKSFFKVA